MINSKKSTKTNAYYRSRSIYNGDELTRYKKLVSMGKVSARIISKLYNPIDSINRFINLALQNVDEDSQSRQFLLESKQGIRKTSLLLKRLNNCARKIEEEVRDIYTAERNGKNSRSHSN